MKGYFSFSIHKNRIKFILLDFFSLLISLLIAYLVRVQFNLVALAEISISKVVIYYLFLLAQMTVLFYIMGVYDRRGLTIFNRSFSKLALACLIMGLFSSLYFYFQTAIYVGRLVLVLQLLIFFFMALLGRYLLILRLNKNATLTPLILINLSDEEKKLLNQERDIRDEFDYTMFRFTRKEELEPFINSLDPDSIIVISTLSDVVAQNLSYFISLKFNNYHIYDAKTFYTDVTGKIPRSSFGEIWNLMSESEFVMGIRSYYRLKRIADIFLSLLGLLLALPFFLLLPILIKITSRGGVFFVQQRLGWNKKSFNLIKFRTMKADAEKVGGPQWAKEKDPRITSIGRFLRKTRLDELPQLLNVLKGEMSVVGTRPIRKHFADILTEEIPYYDVRFFIKPGLTGWSQVKYDYAGSVEGQIEKFKYELFYLKNMSLVLDMVILVKTVKTVIDFKGN